MPLLEAWGGVDGAGHREFPYKQDLHPNFGFGVRGLGRVQENQWAISDLIPRGCERVVYCPKKEGKEEVCEHPVNSRTPRLCREGCKE